MKMCGIHACVSVYINYATYPIITMLGLVAFRFLSLAPSSSNGGGNCRDFSHSLIPAAAKARIKISNTIPAAVDEAMITTGTGSTKAGNELYIMNAGI